MNLVANIKSLLMWVLIVLLSLVFPSKVELQNNGASGELGFLAAVTKGDKQKVSELLTKNPSFARATNRNGVTAVLLAAYHEKQDVVDVLLKSGIELDIFEASATGQTVRVRALIKGDRRLQDAFGRDGFTPLGLATFFGHAETAEALLEAGADPNLKSNNQLKAAPLQSAAVRNRIDIAKLLLARGAKAQVTGESGYTPLHEVAGSGRLEFAKLLLEHGAIVNAKADDGKTPLRIAIENKQFEMANFLRSQGAEQNH